jgi:hypothetical protein
MKLNEKQIKILRRARDILVESINDASFRGKFICHQIYFADTGASYIPTEMTFLETAANDCSQDACSMIDAIHKSLQRHICMEVYLEREAKIDHDKYHGFGYLARIAWLDRILETGRIE